MQYLVVYPGYLVVLPGPQVGGLLCETLIGGNSLMFLVLLDLWIFLRVTLYRTGGCSSSSIFPNLD